MASFDDEDVLLVSVTNYYCLNAKDEPISFAVLPILFEDSDKPDALRRQVYLHGTADGRLRKVYKQIIAWRLGLEQEQPEVMALTKDSEWIRLLKPRKSYEDTIMKILLTTQLLHFLKRKPESSAKSLCDHLRKTVSSFDGRPAVIDMLGQHQLIKLFMERDSVLAKCQLLLMLLKEQQRKKGSAEEFQNYSQSKTSFIVEDDIEEDNGDDDGEEEDSFDSICAICDDGGRLLGCDGDCMRAFHPTKKDGEEYICKSLGFTEFHFQTLRKFFCKNCKYKQHQCFACGKLGSSDKSAAAEVFCCANATCGHFYHPKCVAYLLYKENEVEAAKCQKKISDGEPFTCPVHKCYVCKDGENRDNKELQFAVCRRCPKSYHRKCLPRKIAFKYVEEEGLLQRAWELSNGIVIYCLNHKIDKSLGTPTRNHIVFPDMSKRGRFLEVQNSKPKALVKNKQVSDGLTQNWTSAKPVKKQLKPLKVHVESELVNFDGSVQVDAKRPSGEKVVQLDILRPPKENLNSIVPMISSPSAGKDIVCSETENRMVALMEDMSPSFTAEDVIKEVIVPSTHTKTSSNIDKTIVHGKVDSVVKNKLKGSLASVKHGMHYTSVGRHFIKVDKLKEIVDKLQWYVQNGDTIVDFCCGANDFSRLLKEKIDASAKRCFYKNYDVIRPKNDFNFELKYWMEVQPGELPTGSQLIMGLNPPLGIRAATANKFINRALTFKPKLLILIVPKETERLDRKRPSYNLIWEDSEKLSEQALYLHCSTYINDAQKDQWSNIAPTVYLWSRPDWSTKHREIALRRGHLSKSLQEYPSGAKRLEEQTTETYKTKELVTFEEITREGNDEKFAEQSETSSSSEDLMSWSKKRRKVHRNEHVAAKQMSISHPDASRDLSVSQFGLTPQVAVANNDIDDIAARDSVPSTVDTLLVGTCNNLSTDVAAGQSLEGRFSGYKGSFVMQRRASGVVLGPDAPLTGGGSDAVDDHEMMEEPLELFGFAVAPIASQQHSSCGWIDD